MASACGRSTSWRVPRSLATEFPSASNRCAVTGRGSRSGFVIVPPVLGLIPRHECDRSNLPASLAPLLTLLLSDLVALAIGAARRPQLAALHRESDTLPS